MEIPLTHNHTLIIDKEDYPLVSQYHWRASKNRNTYYAQVGIGKRKTICAHRLIMNLAENELIDHIDGNGLNNSRSNLRRCTRCQNQQNSKHRSHNRSGYRGVHYQKKDNLYCARIGVNGERLYIGCFRHANLAALAYDLWAKTLHGEFAQLNFPEGKESDG